MAKTTRPLLDEPPVYLAEVARRHRVHIVTVARWVRSGLAVGGRRVRLEAVKLGRWRTSDAALGRFAAALADARTAAPADGPATDGERP
jgi:hypothetical protein